MPPPAPFSLKYCCYIHRDMRSREGTVRNLYKITEPFIEDDGDIRPERVILKCQIYDEYGLFDANGVPDFFGVINTLKQHSGLIWRMVVSLQGLTAKRIGFTTRAQWVDSLRQALPHIATTLGIPVSNFCWVAAYHREPGHPHCHILFWEQEPKRTRGALYIGEIRAVKNALIKSILANST